MNPRLLELPNLLSTLASLIEILLGVPPQLLVLQLVLSKSLDSLDQGVKELECKVEIAQAVDGVADRPDVVFLLWLVLVEEVFDRDSHGNTWVVSKWKATYVSRSFDSV